MAGRRRSHDAIEIALPIARLAARLTERKPARLAAGIGLHFENLFAVPGDVKPSGHTQNATRSICFTRVPGRGVFVRIPGGRRAPSLGVNRNAAGIALRRGGDPVSPVLRNLRHPIAGGVERRRRALRLQALAAAQAVVPQAHPACSTVDQARASSGRINSPSA